MNEEEVCEMPRNKFLSVLIYETQGQAIFNLFVQFSIPDRNEG